MGLKAFQFKPGQSGNPNGRPKLPERLRGVRKLTDEEVQVTFSLYARMIVAEVRKIAECEQTPMFDAWIARGMIEGHKRGDFSNMAVLLDRCIGRVRQAMEDMGHTDSVQREILNLIPKEKLVALLTEVDKKTA